MSIPDDDDIADPDNSAFGPTGVMREIVGYAPVEPDGSVRMKVPANIAFQISLLDVNGRRVEPASHRAWLQVRPGEVLECNGCHVRTAPGARRRSMDARACSIPSMRARRHGRRSPGAVNTISPEAGDTMARARARSGSSCIDPRSTGTERCGPQSITPSANVVYDEIWKPAALPTDSFAYNYQQSDDARCPTNPAASRSGRRPAASPFTTPPSARRARVTSIRCGPCRVPPAGVDDGTGIITFPQTCTHCHNRVDPAAAAQLPAASLELTDEVSDEDALQLRAYRQLLFARPELELVNGAVSAAAGSGSAGRRIGSTTTVIRRHDSAAAPHPMAAGNARGSRFFSVMNNPTHAGMLSTAELRLLSEWLDIGAQYYNDPFPPTPQN